ncbi:MAG: hypothetical protein K8U03_02110 [Planctomycetia bacterium]|nr:hypothetical protein [Planctomycetia bacterium]
MFMSSRKWIWISAGLIVGLVIGGFLPHAPLHAVATDRQDNYAIATGHVDAEIEGVFFLDMLTGDLKGAVVNPYKRGIGFTYAINVLKHLELDASKAMKFLMVTGDMEVRPQGSMQYAQCVVYIAEVNSGRMACYVLPFNRGALTNSNGGIELEFVPLFVGPFRQPIVR